MISKVVTKMLKISVQNLKSSQKRTKHVENHAPNEDKGAQRAQRFSSTEAKGVLLVGSLLTGPKSKDGQKVAGNITEHVNCIALDCQRPRQVSTKSFTDLREQTMIYFVLLKTHQKEKAQAHCQFQSLGCSPASFPRRLLPMAMRHCRGFQLLT